MASSSDEPSEDGDQLATARELSANRKQKQRSAKRNLRRSGPLKSGLPSSTPPRLKGSSNCNDEEQLLQQCQAVYSKLPKRSRYAQHKLKCLAKAMELLQRGRCGAGVAAAQHSWQRLAAGSAQQHCLSVAGGTRAQKTVLHIDCAQCTIRKATRLYALHP